MVLLYFTLWLVRKTRPTFLTNEKPKQKPTETCSHAFSRARRRLHEFASTSDWLVVLFVSVLVDQSKRLFPSCLEPHYESEAKCKVFVMKIRFHSYAIKWKALVLVLRHNWKPLCQAVWGTSVLNSGSLLHRINRTTYFRVISVSMKCLAI